MTEREKLVEAMARAMAEPLGARVPYDVLPDNASQPKLADGSGLSQELLLDGATAALAAIEASGAVVVPVKATGAMLESADDALCGVAVGDLAHDIAGDTYAAMLAASPYAKEPT